MRVLALLCAPLLVFAASEGSGKQPVTTTDLLKIKQVTGVEVADDGSFAAYGVQSIHTEPGPEPTYSYRTNLWYIDLNDASAKPVQLTFGDRNDSQLALSPDGKTLAFVRVEGTRGGAQPARPQVFLLHLRMPGEAQAITKLENGAGQPVWRPDSKALLVSSQIAISKLDGKPPFDMDRPKRDWFDYDRAKPNSDKDAKPEKIDARPDGDRRAIRNWLEKNAAKNNPTEITRMNFLGEQALAPEMRIAEVFLVELDKNNKATQLTKDFYSHGDVHYSNDASKIVYVSAPPGTQHPDRGRRAAIWIMNADGSDAKTLLNDAAWSYNSPRYTADGKSMLFSAQQTDEPGFRQAKLGKYNLSNGQITWLAKDWDSGVQRIHEGADGSVLFGSPWHGGELLQRLDGSKLTAISKHGTGVGVFDEGGGKIVMSVISVPNPNELYLVNKDGSMRQLTELNSGWLANKAIVLPEEHWITRPDGIKEQYWVMNPSGAQAGKKYPWVLDMHGGPTAMWGPGEFSMWHEFQLFCAWGYGVVYANPRGSGGYGYAHQRGNYKNWGDAPAKDVLAALDETAKSNAYVDKDRLFLTGGSYAGYLTAWIVGHDDRFKAAVAVRGVYDLTTFFGEANAFRLVENSFGGFPWEPEAKKLLEHESPYTYVAKINTPLLIIHGSEDFRTGYVQSETLYRSLKQMNKPVEYIRYPGVGHELSRSGPPAMRMDHALRIVEFFERYASNDHPAPMESKAN
ncbi:MAG: S9 family peptidase [Bryobacteraceae bacterium]